MIGAERHAIRTPEQVTIEYRLAGLGSRALAWLLDQAIQIAALLLVLRLVSGVLPVVQGALGYIAFFAIQVGYAMALEALWDGQTLGKRALRIRVIDARGFPVSPLSVLVRNAFRWLDALPVAYGVGGAAALLDPRGRRLGDIAAGTVVVSERRPPIPRRVAEGFSRPNSLDRPEIRRRALRRIPPALGEYLLALYLRRDGLEENARYALFQRTAALVAERLDLPEEDFLSAERLLEDVAALLYARRAAARRKASRSAGSGASKATRSPRVG